MPEPCTHHFCIVTPDWSEVSRAVTLRLCEVCGLTHRLVWFVRPRDRWVWERIPEVEQGQAFASTDEEDRDQEGE